MPRRSFEPEPDEEVLLETWPHWWRLLSRLVPTTVLLGMCVAGFLLWASAPIWFAWLLLAVFLAAVLLGVGRLLSWRSVRFVVTSTRVVHRHGVLRRTGREIPIARVQDVTYRQSLLEQMVGIGHLRVESAGVGSAEEVADLRRPAEVQRVVNRAVDAALAGRSRPAAETDLAGQLERLAALCRQGVVTQAEFAAKKAELLARM